MANATIEQDLLGKYPPGLGPLEQCQLGAPNDPAIMRYGESRRVGDLWYPLTNTATTPEDIVAKATMVDASTVGDDLCSVCLDNFKTNTACVKLSRCTAMHVFHPSCITEALRGNLRCPNCTLLYGTPRGAQPPGQMVIALHPTRLPGEETTSVGTYVLVYLFPSGVQTSAHPHPGQPYSGTNRRAFIPASVAGLAVLRKFLRAWDARVLFTVGTSLTTGRQNCVVWGSVHHKTNIGGGPHQFGFPDPSYLASVNEELTNAGIV